MTPFERLLEDEELKKKMLARQNFWFWTGMGLVLGTASFLLANALIVVAVAVWTAIFGG